METIVEYFSNMPTPHRTLQLVGGLTLFLALETTLAVFTKKYNKWSHLGNNLVSIETILNMIKLKNFNPK